MKIYILSKIRYIITFIILGIVILLYLKIYNSAVTPLNTSSPTAILIQDLSGGILNESGSTGNMTQIKNEGLTITGGMDTYGSGLWQTASDGSQTIGKTIKGLREGVRKIIETNGKQELGPYKKGLKEGPRRISTPNLIGGIISEKGPYKNDKREGLREILGFGSTAFGRYKNGLKEGSRIIRDSTKAENNIQELTYHNDILKSKKTITADEMSVVIKTLNTGTIPVIQPNEISKLYENNKIKDGNWNILSSDGTSQVLEYKNNILISIYITYSNGDQGKLIPTARGNAVKQGIWIDHGEIGEYINDKKEGIWANIGLYGNSDSIGEYIHGVQSGPWEYTNFGKKEIGIFKEGNRDGNWKIINPDGSSTGKVYTDYQDIKSRALATQTKEQLENGVKEGVWSIGYEEYGEYINGIKNGIWVKGDVNSEIGQYINGEKVGTWSYIHYKMVNGKQEVTITTEEFNSTISGEKIPNKIYGTSDLIDILKKYRDNYSVDRTSTNGLRSIGKYMSGVKEGIWKWTLPDGTKIIGNYKNDDPIGLWSNTSSNGLTTTGMYKDGKREGFFVTTEDVDGIKTEGNYKNNKKEGLFISTSYVNGNKIIGSGNYKNDKKEGIWNIRDYDGTMKKEQYKDGVLMLGK